MNKLDRKQKKILVVCVGGIIALLLGVWIWVSLQVPPLAGFYQSERDVNGHFVQMAFRQGDGEFVEWIDNRVVDQGTYEETKDGVYRVKGEIQDLEITLNRKNSFELTVKKLNDGKPFSMVFIDSMANVSFGTEFDDEEKFVDLLK